MSSGLTIGRKLAPSSLSYALLQASQVLALVLVEGKSLDAALAEVHGQIADPQARGAVADLSYFGLRWWGRGQGLTQALTGKKRLKPAELEFLLGLSLALLWEEGNLKYPEHTVVDQAVNACAAVKKLHPAKGLVNACLRNFLRDRAKWVDLACQKPIAVWNYPQWWVDQLRKDHPEHWQSILRHGNWQAPMVLRVNQRVSTAEQYLAKLANAGIAASLLGAQSILLDKALPVNQLPGFQEGEVSVQDAAAQMAASLLAPENGTRVLDACAAPGGKTMHLLEMADVEVVALDENADRLAKVQQNYERISPTLNPQCSLTAKAAPAQELSSWFDGKPFDAILADLPCSGSGVVRRHPDIRWLRRPADLVNLSRIQHTILDSLWSTLRPGGTLLVATCSVFAEEGPSLASNFAARHQDAVAQAAPGQLVPTADDLPHYCPDGFFYAKFVKAISV